MQDLDVVIIGAGAAGLFCAATAGARGRRVLVLDRSSRPAAKVRISGGGRCNFTNLEVGIEHFVSSNPRFAYSALNRFTPRDFIRLVEAQGIPYHEKIRGQLFCDGSAQSIVDLLLDDCRVHGVAIRLETDVQAIEHQSDCYFLQTNQGRIKTRRLVIASGGLSIPKLGASDLGYRIAVQFGLNVLTPQPGLVPLSLKGRDLEISRELSGVGLPASVRHGSTIFDDDLLFTHSGLSGPAILQISNYWEQGDPLLVDLLPGIILAALLEEAKNKSPGVPLQSVLTRVLPRRVVRVLFPASAGERKLGELSHQEIEESGRKIQHWQIWPVGTAGFAKAEVTRGGVDTRELDPATFETKRVPGLFFIGEVLDMTGWLGGYNFQWAWSSGYCAGMAL